MPESEAAVIYADQHYVGVGRRLFIDVVDTGVAFLTVYLLTILLILVSPHHPAVYLAVLAIWVAVWFTYFVLLKGSRFRTLGYTLAGAQIVDFHGRRPSRVTLTARLVFVLLGPFNFLLDLLWVSSDDRGQALRDKFAHTFVIRNGAIPAGTGRIVYNVYTIFGGTLLVREIQPAA